MSNLNQTLSAGPTIVPGSLGFDKGRVVVSGRLFRVARIRSEDCQFVDDPENFIPALSKSGLRADLFSFRQRPSELEPKFSYHQEWSELAAVPFSSYESWWKTQIKDKTRNMVRKAGKKGVVLQTTELTDDFLRGIQTIYNECPIRQGKPARHYGKDLETLRREHSTFQSQSEFIGAYCGTQLIGFAKVVYLDDFAVLMNIIALLSEREKAPTNALTARVIERCAEKGIHLLQYGIWSRRTFGDFKLHNAFACFKVPRYFVPLNAKGRLMLRLGLHKKFEERIPETWVDRLAVLKGRYYAYKHRKS